MLVCPGWRRRRAVGSLHRERQQPCATINAAWLSLLPGPGGEAVMMDA
jgi:hypothetical protein